MKNIKMILLSIMILGLVGCATGKTGGAMKTEPYNQLEMEQIRLDRMLSLQDKHI